MDFVGGKILSTISKSRKALAGVYVIQFAFIQVIFVTQMTDLTFSSLILGYTEVALMFFPLTISWFLTMNNKPIKKYLVTWSVISLIIGALCMYEGTVLGYGILRTWWSFVYIIPTCVSLYYSGQLKKW